MPSCWRWLAPPTGDNHARLTLSAWVLQAHFRQVLVFANERLGVIGAGRYELINVDSEEDTRQQKQGFGPGGG